jgi:hypothetical protein
MGRSFCFWLPYAFNASSQKVETSALRSTLSTALLTRPSAATKARVPSYKGEFARLNRMT